MKRVLALLVCLSIAPLSFSAGETAISGTVTAASDGTLLVGVGVLVFDGEGNEIAFRFTDEFGVYATEDELDGGSYFVRTIGTEGFADELFDNRPCPIDCDPLSGDAVVVIEGETTTVDFALDAGASISGTITSSTAEPAELENVVVQIADGGGSMVFEAVTDASGFYDTGPVFGGGSFYVRTFLAEGHLSEVYDDEACPFVCDVTAEGTTVDLTPGSAAAGIDFVLEPGAVISGSVVDAGDPGTGVEGSFVALFDQLGLFAAGGGVDSIGDYVVPAGFPPGTFFALVVPPDGSPYIGELHEDIWCPYGCFATDGTPLEILSTGDQVTLDFELESYGVVSGQVLGNDTQLGVEGVTVSLHDSSGSEVTTALTGGDGSYTTDTILVPGTVFARTHNGVGYLDELFDDIPCSACDETTGDAISVISGSTTPMIDFELDKGSSISGLVTDAATFGALPNVLITVFDTSGQGVTQTSTDGSGSYQTDSVLQAGNYLVLTTNDSGFVDKVWDDVSCNGCDVTAVGTPLEVPASTDVTGIDFVLARPGSIAGRVTLAGTDDGIEEIIVGIFDDEGQPVTAAITDPNGAYLTDSVFAPGFYYAMTIDSGEFLPEIYQEISCPVECLATNGDAIDLGPAEAVVGIDFSIESGGWISGNIEDTGANPIQGIWILIHDSSGSVVTGAESDATGFWSCDPLLPSGDYFVATTDNPAWLDRVFDGLPCNEGCDVTEGDVVAVIGDAATGGVDFVLEMDPDVFSDGFESGDLTGWSAIQ